MTENNTLLGDIPTIPNVLSIAGSDPSGGAGIQADIKSISANGGYAMAALTALTAQNTQGVTGALNIAPEFVRAQLDAVAEDVHIDAIKIGMLSSADIITAVRAFLQDVKKNQSPAPTIVLDPVMVATSGDRLLDEEAEAAIKELLAEADLITPNIPELAVLSDSGVAETLDAARTQATALAQQHDVLVLLKGGHLPANADGQLTDELVGAEGVIESFNVPHIASPNTHGTGCSLSSALATQYARTGDWVPAVTAAQAWLNQAIADSGLLTVGGGTEEHGPQADPTAVERTGHGPINHFGQLWG
ncbi:bifunctional hydroxymethylpyrimidine kinase/phosphomethylpyrimidine kinase [Micrococcoides hystricis]|uniref:Bifunctional hydroxymethylpyrimidine kinase/phosphomethylpyrimidine kinase n=1 Tax=Micrococcoides hystricis TaxID=1572761 RepID=A0ABV6PDE3_9MICC